MDGKSLAKEYRKEIIREIVQKGVSLQVQEEWHNIKQSIMYYISN